MGKPNIEAVLNERGKRYGEFKEGAILAQHLKHEFYSYSTQRSELTELTREALDMIFHKIARIGNGDQTYLDNWVDIAGYAQLVVNELSKGSK